MTRTADNQNRTEIVRSIALVALIIVMDLSGFAGLANQDRLEDVPDYRGTNSTDSDGDGVPDDEDDYPNDPYRVGPYQNEGIGHIILVSEGGQTGFNFDDVAITFVEYSSNITNISSYLTDFDNLSVGTSVTDQYLSQGALYSVVLGGPVAGTIGDLVNGTHGISDFGSSLPNAVIVGGIQHAVRIDIIDPDTGLAETAARGIEMRLGDGDSGNENFRVEVYDHNGSILHNESFTTYGGAVNGGVNFSYWYPFVDSDGDGTLDGDDAFPLDPTEDSDFDGNGVGDNAQFAEFDLDGDGVWDEVVNMPGIMDGLANTSTTVDHSINGQMGTCAILNNGSMMCWGTGHYSNTGVGPGWQFRQTPSYAALPPGRTAVEVSMGVSQNCVLLDNNSVACWGRYWPAGLDASSAFVTGWELGTPTIVSTLPANAVSITVADGFNDNSHTCAIMENGSVYCWGSNKNGQLGLGFRCVENNSESPIGNECHDGSDHDGEHTYYIGNASQMILPPGRTAVGMHLTHHRSLIVLDDHSMICYGQNCGASGDYVNYVYVDNGHKITAVFDGRVLTSDGTVLPIDGYGQPSLVPHTYNSQVGPFSEADRHCASLRNGSVACNTLGSWIANRPTDGSGFGHQGHWYVPSHNLTAGGVQSDHWKACAVLSNGDIECWGFNGGPHNPNWDGGWLGVDYYCQGENDSNGCDSANFVLSPRRIVLPRPLMVQEMDLDGDGISKLLDRCADGESGWTSNSSTDFDGDGCRDATEDDDDNGDGISDPLDSDCDGIGDEADPDDDNDGIPDETDAFPYNPYEWSDMDNDGTGDNCDCDIDGDGVSNDIDAFPTDPFAHTDTDGDGMPDEITGITTNQQGIGFVILSATFPTPSGFNVDDIEITFLNGNSNLSYLIDFEDLPRTTVVTDQYLDRGMNFSDLGGDGVTLRIADVVLGDWWTSDFGGSLNNSLVVGGGAIRIDIIDPNTGLSGTFANGIEMRLGDGDSAPENFRVEVYDHNGLLLHNESFTTYSGPVNGGVNFSYWYPSTTTNLTEDLDDDNDGILDINDAFPLDPTEDIDTDGDGVGDNADDDDDGDGYSDLMDAFPLDSSEWLDTDGDVIGDNTDTDDDNDGSLDIDDAFPLDPSDDTDTDGDGVGDKADEDDEGDGVSDAMDAFPLNPAEWIDTDGDGMGDNADSDDDDDGSLDWDDAFPLDPSEDSDTDGDGVGDNADDDADGDGEVDNETALSIGPLNPSNSLKLSLLINLIVVLLATLVISSRRSSSGLNLVGFEKMPEPQITTTVKDRKEVLEKYLSQGYSPELANTLADNEMRKS